MNWDWWNNIRRKFFWKSSLNGNKRGKCDEPWFCQKWSSLFKSVLSIHRELTKIVLWINFYCHHSLKASMPEFAVEDLKNIFDSINLSSLKLKPLEKSSTNKIYFASKNISLQLVYSFKIQRWSNPTSSGWPMFLLTGMLPSHLNDWARIFHWCVCNHSYSKGWNDKI